MVSILSKKIRQYQQYYWYLSILCLAVITGCAGPVKQPEWLTSQPASYPAKQYLVAVGEADNQALADNRALANLAKIFEVSIADISTDLVQSSVSGHGVNRKIKTEQQLSRSINTEVRQVLEGARITDRYKGANGLYHSLVVLKKSAVGRPLRRSILAADRETTNLIAFAKHQEATNPFLALATLDKAQQVQRQRASNNRKLHVLSGRGVNEKNSSADIEQMIRQLIADLRFEIDADTQEEFDLLSAALGGVGSQIADNAPYLVNLKLDKLPIKYRQNWYWQRGAVELTIYNDSGAIVKKRWPFKVSGQEPDLTEQRLYDHLTEHLPGYFYTLLTDTLSK
ncbi:LPP20 family lipoprotein [Endozoicomonas sp. SM1973]|uniref:LPP20 family lipoprotein n=1 Tax=Spartinivicinus marinus TaxID=2994442 RepID=A0A853HX00_9GAMM|nr:LPP20 family lipoprotein [Spartinivicinus marinus]MCX4024703.1 LPP20 family lipoprotein [Spartinivicinus marinus]NYZ66270.1 LPP20 family lipoprotein [Spartinivicinus marinus]